MKHIGRFILENKSTLPPETELNILTVNQLKEFAVENGIELGSAKTKAEIIEIISAFRE